MSYTRKKSSRPAKTARGFLAIGAAAVVIFAIVLAIVHLETSLQDQFTDEPLPESTVTEPTLTPGLYAPTDFVYDDAGYLTCTAGNTTLGIDVSDHQNEIDWNAVASSGIEFVMVRIGYRGYTQGEIFSDKMAHINLQGARDAGLKIGAYFFSQAVNEEEAAQEAAFCVAFLNDYELDLPMVYDWEPIASENARTASMDPDTLTACAESFCRTVEDAGLEPMIYFNLHLASNLYRLTELDHYPFWLALYSDTLDYPNYVEMWQYTDSAIVPGISTGVDLNLLFTDAP